MKKRLIVVDDFQEYPFLVPERNIHLKKEPLPLPGCNHIFQNTYQFVIFEQLSSTENLVAFLLFSDTCSILEVMMSNRVQLPGSAAFPLLLPLSE